MRELPAAVLMLDIIENKDDDPLNKHAFRMQSLCLKITEKVSFNIASEASYVYILSGQKFMKNAKNSQF